MSRAMLTRILLAYDHQIFRHGLRSLIEREEIPDSILQQPAEVDHRGIVLPRRHSVGGIITPQ